MTKGMYGPDSNQENGSQTQNSHNYIKHSSVPFSGPRYRDLSDYHERHVYFEFGCPCRRDGEVDEGGFKRRREGGEAVGRKYMTKKLLDIKDETGKYLRLILMRAGQVLE